MEFVTTKKGSRPLVYGGYVMNHRRQDGRFFWDVGKVDNVIDLLLY